MNDVNVQTWFILLYAYYHKVVTNYMGSGNSIVMDDPRFARLNRIMVLKAKKLHKYQRFRNIRNSKKRKSQFGIEKDLATSNEWIDFSVKFDGKNYINLQGLIYYIIVIIVDINCMIEVMYHAKCDSCLESFVYHFRNIEVYFDPREHL